MSNRTNFLWLALGAVGIYYIYSNRQQVGTAMQQIGSTVTAAVSGWKTAGSGPTWIPILNATETQFNLPTDMLAALAYQESSFIENVIRGLQPSSAGALGMMQLMPQYYDAQVGPAVPTPYSDDAVNAQIQAAAQTLASNYNTLGSWELAVAAYNAGVGAVQKAGGIPQNGQTPAYVAGIEANAPAMNA
jgi:soluble lytic murein transglycosylase-like protein